MIIEGNWIILKEAVEQAGQSTDRIAIPIGGGEMFFRFYRITFWYRSRNLAAEYEPFSRVERLALIGQCSEFTIDHAAAALSANDDLKTTLCVVTGGNTDPELHARVINIHKVD